MTHPDPRTAEIQARNARELAAALGAPPREIADNFAAYLRWSELPPESRPTAPRNRTPGAGIPEGLQRPGRRRGPAGEPPALAPPADVEAERRKQLDALEALMAAENHTRTPTRK